MSDRKCMYCQAPLSRGGYLKRVKYNCIQGFYCKSELRCFNRLLKQRDALLLAGNQMSNVFYNIAQRDIQLHPDDKRIFTQMHQLWDAKKRETI